MHRTHHFLNFLKIDYTSIKRTYAAKNLMVTNDGYVNYYVLADG